MQDLQLIADEYYAQVANGDFVPTREACDYFKDHIRRIEAVWMENRDPLVDERRIKSDIESEKSVDSAVLLETLKCMCTVNLLISDDDFMERAVQLSAIDIATIDEQRLAMADGPILCYSVSELRDAMWQVVAMWRNITINDSVTQYVELLELRYALLLRCAYDGSVHDVPEYRQSVDGAENLGGVTMYTSTPAMMVEMTAQFGGLCDMMWTKTAFDARVVFRSSCLDQPPMNVVVRMAETLRIFSEVTKSLSTLQQTYVERCLACSLRPGEADIFAPENPLYPVSPHNILLMCRGRKQHAAVQDLALRKIRDVMQIVCNKINAATTPEDAELSWDEEVAVVCVTDMLFKNRFRLDWEQLYVVYQAEFRAQRQKFSGVDSLPLVFNNCTRFNVWHRGTLIETNNAVASVVVWLDLVRTVYAGRAENRDISSLCNILDMSMPDFSFKSVLGSKLYTAKLNENAPRHGNAVHNAPARTVIELRKAM